MDRPHGNTGRKQSPEHIAKRIAANRANGTYEGNGKRLAALNKSRIGIPHSEETKRKRSASMMGRSTAWLAGCKHSEEHRRNTSKFWKLHPEKHNHYKDGKSGERRGERKTAMAQLEYRLWREKVFERDDWTCVNCGQRGGKLHADHIKPWATHPQLRYDLNNGQTLCVSCHRQTPTFGYHPPI